MRSTLYIDEYGLVNVTYLIHASPFNPCGEDDCEPQSWFIGLLFTSAPNRTMPRWCIRLARTVTRPLRHSVRRRKLSRCTAGD